MSDDTKRDDNSGEVTETKDQPTMFSRNLRVGFRERGHGHGDYGILQGNALVAKLLGLAEAKMLPSSHNAALFAAAPELYDACLSALNAFKDAGNADPELVAQLDAALKKAVGE